MPVYDIRCDQCADTQIDTWETKSTNPLRSCPCGGTFQRMTLSSGYGKAPGVISDECDIVVRHGICNEDGSPRRYRFKSEMRAEKGDGDSRITLSTSPQTGEAIQVNTLAAGSE
jgi:hypothetical protein